MKRSGTQFNFSIFFFLFYCSPKRPLVHLQPRHSWSSTSSAPLTTPTVAQSGKWLIQATSWVAPAAVPKQRWQWGQRQNGVWTALIPNRNAKNNVDSPLHHTTFSFRRLETTQQRMEIALLTGIWNAWKRRLELHLECLKKGAWNIVLECLKTAPGTPSGTPEIGTWNAI